MRPAVGQTRRKKLMKKAILATKVGMTQIFNEDGGLLRTMATQQSR